MAYQTKIGLFIISILLFALVIENITLKKEVAQLKKENSQNRMNIEEINKILALEKESGDPQKTTYDSWMDSKKLSIKFYQESNEQFPKDWGLFLAEKAKQYSINPNILFELIRIETGGTFDSKTVGPETSFGKAYGLTQFMENTSPWIAKIADLPYEKELLYNPYYSIELAAVYLNLLFGRYNNWDEALTAYHRGIYGLESFINENGHAKSWYAKEIQQKAKKLEMVTVN